MKVLRCYKRVAPQPRWSQDCLTYILLGSNCHLYNAQFRVWFVTSPAPRRVEDLQRGATQIVRITLREWLAAVGPRGRWEILEDLLGVRSGNLARRLLRFPFPERIRERLQKVANRDAVQDLSGYLATAEPPKFSV